MNLICPVCNSLLDYDIKCSICGKKMEDNGRLTDYYDNYSPYLEMSTTEKVDGAPSNQCIHLYSCQKCKIDKRIKIDKVIK